MRDTRVVDLQILRCEALSAAILKLLGRKATKLRKRRAADESGSATGHAADTSPRRARQQAVRHVEERGSLRAAASSTARRSSASSRRSRPRSQESGRTPLPTEVEGDHSREPTQRLHERRELGQVPHQVDRERASRRRGRTAHFRTPRRRNACRLERHSAPRHSARCQPSRFVVTRQDSGGRHERILPVRPPPSRAQIGSYASALSASTSDRRMTTSRGTPHVAPWSSAACNAGVNAVTASKPSFS